MGRVSFAKTPEPYLNRPSVPCQVRRSWTVGHRTSIARVRHGAKPARRVGRWL